MSCGADLSGGGRLLRSFGDADPPARRVAPAVPEPFGLAPPVRSPTAVSRQSAPRTPASVADGANRAREGSRQGVGSLRCWVARFLARGGECCCGEQRRSARVSGSWRSPRLVLAGLASVAFVAALVVGRWLFPLGSINHDEPMYVFEARLLRRGHLTLPASFSPFRPWASGVRGGRLVLKYAPVWPSVLAIGASFGSMRFAGAAAAAAAVVLMGLLGRELFGRWIEGLVAAAILVLSPVFLVQAGTYLPYVFQLVLDLAVVLLVLGALRRWPQEGAAPRRVVGRLVVGGVVWGLAVFAREYDALLLALPLLVAALVLSRQRQGVLRAWIASATVGAAAPLVGLAAYNWVLMGNPF